ncbi:MAG: hypothetical protein NKF70_00340 [Methanobacterium sp. ERen5]|nr:MAG: hypothetical protein NKF70_00340 [Methanobacterium sp. ERen5]
MENEKCGCEENIEKNDESIKDTSKEECGCEAEDTNNSLTDKTDEDCGCSCGGIDFPDESSINNPSQPKFIANDDFFNEFENYAHSIGIKNVGYTQISPDLLIMDKFIQYSNAIVLTMEMGKEIIEAPLDQKHKN